MGSAAMEVTNAVRFGPAAAEPASGGSQTA